MSASRLTIRDHVTALVCTCSLGGLLLAGSVLLGSRELGQREQLLEVRASAVRDIGDLRSATSDWLAVVDAIFVEGERTSGVLEEVALRGAENLLLRTEALRAGSPEASQRWHCGELEEALAGVRDALRELDGADSTDLAEVRERVFTRTEPLPAAFSSLETEARAAHTAAVVSVTSGARHFRTGFWIGTAAYLLAVFVVWRWSSVRLVRPLQSLTTASQRALEAGSRLEADAHGPREVRHLAHSLSTLVNTLELARDSMRVRAAETEALVEALPAVLIGLDGDGHVVSWNAAATNCFGLLRKQALDRSILELPISWVEDDVPKRLHDSLGDPEPRLLAEVPFVDTKGLRRLLSITTTPVANGGRRAGVLILGTDITEQKSLEAQVRHSQKLESVGQLAAGIAHEINTPIQYVGHSIHFLREAFEDMGAVLVDYQKLRDCVRDVEEAAGALASIERAEEEADMSLLEEEVPGAIDRAIEGVNRVATIVGAMKRFAHPGVSEFAPSDLNDAVRTTLTVANNAVRYVADVELDLGPIPPVECDLGDVNQVLLNLIVNAAQAIEEKVQGTEERGVIRVTTRLVADRVELEVADTGGGIPAEITEDIFNPFFTTKEVGKGTGQGLAIAHNIIREKHHGELSFQSRVGAGTTFRIALPVRQRVAA